MTVITLELTQEELALLWQLLNTVNIPGQVAEIFVGLKAKARVAMKSLEQEAGRAQ